VPEMAQEDAAQGQGHRAGGAQEGPRRGKTGKGKLLEFSQIRQPQNKVSYTE
jgi:hypothetical protein